VHRPWKLVWLLPVLGLLALIGLPRLISSSSATVRLAAPSGLYGGGPVDFVAVGFYVGFFVNARPAARAELRCARFPWLRRMDSSLPSPDGWTRDVKIAWNARRVTVTQGNNAPLVFSGRDLTRFRFCL
jgi:hypothetical protein